MAFYKSAALVIAVFLTVALNVESKFYKLTLSGTNLLLKQKLQQLRFEVHFEVMQAKNTLKAHDLLSFLACLYFNVHFKSFESIYST